MMMTTNANAIQILGSYRIIQTKALPVRRHRSCVFCVALSILDEVETDLKELQVDYLDLVLLHEPCVNVDAAIDAYKQLETLFLQKKVKAIGVSNFDIELLEELMKEVTVPPAVNQCRFSIGSHLNSSKGRSTDALHYCQAHNITYEGK